MDTRDRDSQALEAAMFRAFSNCSEDFISCIDRDRRLVFVNRTLSRDRAELLGHPVESFIVEDQREMFVQAAERAFRSGEPHSVEYEVELADGTKRVVQSRLVPFTGPADEPLAVVLTSEIGEERRLRRALSQSEELRQLIVENLPDFVVLLDRERRFRWVNRLAPGLALKDVLGSRIDEYIAEEDRDQVRSAISEAFETGRHVHYQSRAYGDGKDTAWYTSRVVPVAVDGSTDNVLVITSDVTDRRRAELALRASEERFRALAEHSPDFIVIVNRAREVEYMNRGPVGSAASEAIGRRVDDFTREEQLPQAIAALESVFETGKAAEYEARAPGDDAIYRVRLAPFASAEGRARVLMVATDITQARANELVRESLQAQLHQAQRRESIGTLAGGIAHDFNNLLQVIQSNIYFAQELAAPLGMATDELGEAMRATERAAELTTHLLAIGHRQRVDPKTVDLAVLIERSLRMLRRVIPENIVLEFRAEKAPCSVSADPPQLEQVLLNLCLNARDAMPAGGRLHVAVRAVEGVPPIAELSVSDTGGGISDEHIKRVFEPFFTTKGNGSGLGLAVAQGIIAAHGGAIRAESMVGQGSTFTVELPLVSSARPDTGPPPAERARGNELLLVAEDEPLVRAQLVRILKRAGYSVLEAENGTRAVELFRSQQDEIRLVLLDVIMPGLDGWQVFSRLEELKPAVKVVFITGYAAHALPEDFVSRGKRLLSKPYKPHVLLEVVREVLDGG